MNVHTSSERPSVFGRGARFSSLAAAAAVAFAALLGFGAAAPAYAHDQLIDTNIESTDEQGPVAVVLTFNNKPLAVGSELIVTGEDGENVVSGEIEVVDNSVRQALDAPLAPGSYEVVWRVVSSDGHPIEGTFEFEADTAAQGDAAGTDESTDGTAGADESADEGTNESTDESGASDNADAEESTEESSGTLPWGVWLATGAAVAAAIVTSVVAMRKRAKSADTPEKE